MKQLAFLGLVSLIATTGCTVTTTSSDIVTVTWDQSYCTDGAASVVISFDGSGYSDSVDCTAGTTTYVLDSAYGYHELQAYLEDSTGAAISDTYSRTSISDGDTVQLTFATVGATDIGTLDLTWTIDGGSAASGCSAHSAVYAEIDVTVDSSTTVYTANCTDGDAGYSIPLPIGSYSATVTLNEQSNTPVTTQGSVTFDITAGTSVPATFDFNSASFLAGFQ